MYSSHAGKTSRKLFPLYFIHQFVLNSKLQNCVKRHQTDNLTKRNVFLHNRYSSFSFVLWCNMSTDVYGEHMECCIDLLYLSTALCSIMQSSRLAQDSRREPSVSKYSSRWRNAAAAIINSLCTSQPSLLSLCPGPRWWRDYIFSPPAPLWLNPPHFPAGLFWKAGHSLLQWSPSLSSVPCF